MNQNDESKLGDGSETDEGGGGSRGRAQEGHEIEARAAAARLESDLRLRDGASVRDIILAHPGVRVLLVATAIRNLGAQKFYFDRKLGRMVNEDDASTQMKAVAWLAAYSDGLPVQTNLNVNASAGRAPDSEELLAASPAAIEAMERTLARAKERFASAKEKRVGPVGEDA